MRWGDVEVHEREVRVDGKFGMVIHTEPFYYLAAALSSRGWAHERQDHWRFGRGKTCPVCGGSDNDRRGQATRCHGFISSDGDWVHCLREEHAGKAQFEPRRRPISTAAAARTRAESSTRPGEQAARGRGKA